MKLSNDCYESSFSKTDVPVADILAISSLLHESDIKRQHWFPQGKSKMQLLIINKAPVLIC